MTKLKQVWEKFKDHVSIAELGADGSKFGLEFLSALGLVGSSLTPVTVGLGSVGLLKKGLDFYVSKTKTQNLEEWVGIAFPLAYILSFDALVQKNEWLRNKIDIGGSEREIKQQSDNYLEGVELTSEQSQEALKNFPNSSLGHALNHQLSIYLKQVGLGDRTIDIVTGWVAWGTIEQIESLLSYEESKNTDILKKVKLDITAARETGATQKFSSIEDYLKEQISPNSSDPLRLDKWKVFDEPFKIPDIYVPLKAQLLDSNGKVKKDEENKDKDIEAVDLETWAKDQLTNSSYNGQVMFIQAGPGRGKSVFCRMFADWVREHSHPVWTPILIRLRDIDAFEPNIENTLRAAIKEDFAKSDGWLTDGNTRFLFILDGFDELRFEGRTASGIEKFLKQVGSYQTSCQNNPKLGPKSDCRPKRASNYRSPVEFNRRAKFKGKKFRRRKPKAKG